SPPLEEREKSTGHEFMRWLLVFWPNQPCLRHLSRCGSPPPNAEALGYSRVSLRDRDGLGFWRASRVLRPVHGRVLAAGASGCQDRNEVADLFVNVGGVGDGVGDFFAEDFAETLAQAVDGDAGGGFVDAKGTGDFGVGNLAAVSSEAGFQ